MDGSRSLGRLRDGYGVLLMVVIAALSYQDPCRCWAANNEESVQMKVKEGVVIHGRDWFHRRLLQETDGAPSPQAPPSPPPPPPAPAPPPPSTETDQPVDSPPPSQALPSPPSPPSQALPDPFPPFFIPPPPKPNQTAPPAPATSKSDSKSSKRALIIGLLVAAGLVFLSVCGFCVFYWNSKASHTVKPWMAGLSGQLQKAFVTGVPKLNRSELESACEDFSNVIGTSSIGKVFKGTLSSGVEIAVISLATGSTDDWSKALKAQFRKKIEALSKINHKNFINLIGYCEEDSPFTRMLVFEYAPNGTLFEHLHIKESEHLDWGMRLRISMGIAYCLEHMHQLKPPAIHKNLCSSAISLSEDYAAKVTDFTFWNEKGATEIQSADVELMQSSTPSNVACFGALLFETVTGKGTHLMSSEYIHSWASDYLSDSTKAPTDIVDLTLGSVPPAEVLKVVKVIQSCVHPDSKCRPAMKEVTAMMREITGIGPDRATPKISPLWWAELEVISTDEN